MAAITASPSSVVATNFFSPPAPPSIQTCPSTYLHRRAEELKTPEITAKLIAGHEFDSRLWKGMAIATLVAFTVLAVGTFVAVGIFAPVYLPIVAITAYYFATLAAKRFEVFGLDSSLAQAEADRLRGVAQEFNALPDDARVTGHQLTLIRVPGAETLSNPTQFRPLIAHHNYWIKQQEGFNNMAAALLLKVTQVNAAAAAAQKEKERSELLGRASNLRLEALMAEDNALMAKMRAAFVHAVIQRPEFVGAFENVAMCSPPSFKGREVLADQAVAQHFHDPAADYFVVFKNRNIQPITRAELNNDHVRLIAERFAQAMASAAA